MLGHLVFPFWVCVSGTSYFYDPGSLRTSSAATVLASSPPLLTLVGSCLIQVGGRSTRPFLGVESDLGDWPASGVA